MRLAMLQEMQVQTTKGQRADTSFKAVGWAAIVTATNIETAKTAPRQRALTRVQCVSQWDQQRSWWKEWKFLRDNKSGWTFNNYTQLYDAPSEEAWDNHILVSQPRVSSIIIQAADRRIGTQRGQMAKDQPLLNRIELADLLDSNQATGKWAQTVTALTAPPTPIDPALTLDQASPALSPAITRTSTPAGPGRGSQRPEDNESDRTHAEDDREDAAEQEVEERREKNARGRTPAKRLSADEENGGPRRRRRRPLSQGTIVFQSVSSMTEELAEEDCNG